jgi:transcriptional regulator with GAF, ATPase, and Fis domain
VIGVLAVFSRAAPDPARREALERVAALGAVALGHLRVARELAVERNRLVARAAAARRGAISSVGRADGPETAGGAATSSAARAGVSEPARGAATSSAARAGVPEPAPLPTLADTERAAIARALAHTRGRVSGPRGAARLLGLKPTTLFSRMKKLGVERRPR